MKTQPILRLLGLVSLIALLAFAQTVLAATVTLRVASVEGAPNSTVDVPINIEGAKGIGAVQFDLLYDPAVVKAQSITRGPVAGDNALLESNVIQPGRMRAVFATTDGMKGDGVFATARFTVIGNTGQSSALTLESSRAWEPITHIEALVKTEPGKVTVAADYTLWLLIAAICLVSLLLMAIIVVWLLSRRRRPAPAQSAPSPGYAPPSPSPRSGPPPPPSLPERAPSSDWVCSKCKTNNRPTARFCTKCGTPR